MNVILDTGNLYAYHDSRYISQLRVGYFLGMISAQKLSQSFDDDIEKEQCYVFATSPGKDQWGKKNERVPVRCLTKVWNTSEIKVAVAFKWNEGAS